MAEARRRSEWLLALTMIAGSASAFRAKTFKLEKFDLFGVIAELESAEKEGAPIVDQVGIEVLKHVFIDGQMPRVSAGAPATEEPKQE